MVDPNDDPVDEILARSRDRAERYAAWLAHLRAGDPAFAEASALYPPDMSNGSPPCICSPATTASGASSESR